MSIHELHFNEKGEITETLLKDPQIQAARPDILNDLPEITSVEHLRDAKDYEREHIAGDPTRIRKLIAKPGDRVTYEDYVIGAGENGITPVIAHISRRTYVGSAINRMGIIVDNKTFGWAPAGMMPPTEVFVTPKQK